MFRTVKVKLAGNVEPLIKTAALYTQACQFTLNYGFKNKIYDKKSSMLVHMNLSGKSCPNYPLDWYSVREIKPQRC